MSVLDIEGDANRIWDTIQGGGVAIFPLTVAYAIVAQTISGIDRTYQAKGRSYSKPCGTFGNFDIVTNVLDIDNRAREIVEAVVRDYDLTMSVIGPYHADHEFFSNVDPLCIERCTKNGTIDILMNAGKLHNALATKSWQNKFPIIGSSANASLTGSKFRLQDVEQQVLDAADITVDYGLVPLHNPELISSTIIDVETLEVHRFGANYEMIQDIISRHFNVSLPDKPASRDELIRGAALGDRVD